MKGQTRCPLSLLRPSPSHVSHQALSIRLTLSLLLSFHHHHLTLRRRTPPTLLHCKLLPGSCLSVPLHLPPPHIPPPNTLSTPSLQRNFQKNPSFKSFHIPQPRHPSRQFYCLHRVSSQKLATENRSENHQQLVCSTLFSQLQTPSTFRCCPFSVVVSQLFWCL